MSSLGVAAALEDGGQTGGSAKPPSIEEAAAFIRVAEAQQNEQIQVVLDGAELAAEQVQDKRLELLEAGPEVTLEDAIWDFVWVFVTETPLVGAALGAVTKRILIPRLRTRISASHQASKALEQKMKPSPGAEASLARLSVPERFDRARLLVEIRDLNRSASLIARVDYRTQQALPYLIGAAKAGKTKRTPNLPQLPPDDTPGVGLLAQVKSYTSDLRLSTRIDHAFHEQLVRSRLMSPTEAVEAVKWEPVTEPLSLLRDHYKRRFELLIWTLLLSEQFQKTGTGFTKKEPEPRNLEFLVKHLGRHVPGSLLRYWLRRFVDPETDRPFTDVIQHPALAKPIDVGVRGLQNHMWGILKTLHSTSVAAVVQSTADQEPVKVRE